MSPARPPEEARTAVRGTEVPQTNRPDNVEGGALPHDDVAEKVGVTPAEHITGYGGGHVTARHGKINWWLMAVYLVMFLWALYYGYVYWGGLGPGLDLAQ